MRQRIDSATSSIIPSVIILAAGQGKRMNSPLAKVLHNIAGKPLIYHVLSTIRATLPNAPIALVVGHQREEVKSYIRSEETLKEQDITFVIQEEQLGTGHA